ncbi:MAG: protoporphyrinogen oxidase [Opitutales bacterium]
MSGIAVLGAGVCGLVAARDLRVRGHEVLLFEAGPEVGGVIGCENCDGYLLETGPNTLALRADSAALELFAETDLLKEAVDANPDADKRFVIRGGKLIPVPTSPTALLGSGLLSFGAKLRLLLEPLLPRGKNPDETVAAFVKRRLGEEPLDYMIDPFVSGVYAASPESMVLRHAFPLLAKLETENRSLILGGMALAKKRKRSGKPKTRLISFPDGLRALPQRLARDLQNCLKTNAPVRKVSRRESGWEVEWTENEEKKTGSFDAVWCALPAHQLTSIEWENVESREDLELMAESPYHPVTALYHGFRKEDVKHPLDGFGFLVPRKENRCILGTLFSSTLFAGRAPDGHVLLTTFVGGERQPDLAVKDDHELHSLALAELHSLLGLRDDPVFRHLRRWPQAIPLPDHGQDGRLAAARRVADSNPGLRFTGSHLDGVSLPDCIAGALQLSSSHG